MFVTVERSALVSTCTLTWPLSPSTFESPRGYIMDECRGVLAEHGDVRNAFDLHQGGREFTRQGFDHGSANVPLVAYTSIMGMVISPLLTASADGSVVSGARDSRGRGGSINFTTSPGCETIVR